MTTLPRRAFFGRLGAAALLPLQEPQSPLAGQGEVGTLRDPTVAGRPRAPTEIADYDERIKAIEQRLACTCGCTLDIFTCRTTDFTCTYSPELHREVVELDRAGKTAQEILDAFVTKYGEKALMAPKPEGFNLWGYLLPGSAILLGGGALVAFISRRRVAVAEAAGRGSGPAPDIAPSAAQTPVASAGTPEEMERLRRALAEVDD
ncbi:MAG TPA: cytochrome c-type biogenesis protein CcmH [Gemmatimonadales bacterium]|nr:cytochrome c-type biogenesis protein CcmH [Gemmatimonadales bacterium]